MNEVWYRARAELRSRWGTVLALAIFIAVAGGTVLAVAIGTRRNATAFDRMVAATHPPDVIVTPSGTPSSRDWSAVRRLPQVRSLSVVDELPLTPTTSDTRHMEMAGATQVLRPVDAAFLRSVSAPKILAGRIPDARRVDEAFVNEQFASEYHVAVGDRISLASANVRGSAQRAAPEAVTVTGIGRFASEVIDADGYGTARVVTTPAFGTAHQTAEVSSRALVTLRHGDADVAGFERAVRSGAPGQQIAFATLADEVSLVHRDTWPVSTALLYFAIIFAVLAMVLLGQIVARIQRSRSEPIRVLRALGISSNRQYFAAMAIPLAGLALGLVGAVAVAIGMSPLFPVGAAAQAEPHPGLAINASWLAAGVAVIAITVFEVATLVTWNIACRVTRHQRPARPSRLARQLQRLGAPLTAVYGTRRAIESDNATGRSARIGLIGASAGVASIVLAIVFVSNLNVLLHTPQRFGWTWNRLLQTDQAVNSDTIIDVGNHLAASSDVAGWADIVPASLTVNGHSVPGIGLRPGTNQLLPTIAAGRVPAGLGEIALGGRTLRELHLHLGDTVDVGVAGSTLTQPETIVGQVVLPTLGVPGGDNTEIGVGAVVRIPGGPVSSAALDPLTHMPTTIAMEFPNNQPPSVIANALGPYAQRVTSGRWTMLSRTQRPSDIVGLSHVDTAPIVLAGVMAAVIIGAIVFALFGSLRSRHREIAVLKSLGFVRRQLASAVAWEATMLSVVACAAGLILGIAAGRWAWMLFSDSLGIARSTELPLGLLVATAAVTLLVANVAAIVPARRAARTPAAAILRGE